MIVVTCFYFFQVFILMFFHKLEFLNLMNQSGYIPGINLHHRFVE